MYTTEGVKRERAEYKLHHHTQRTYEVLDYVENEFLSSHIIESYFFHFFFVFSTCESEERVSRLRLGMG